MQAAVHHGLNVAIDWFDVVAGCVLDLVMVPRSVLLYPHYLLESRLLMLRVLLEIVSSVGFPVRLGMLQY